MPDLVISRPTRSNLVVYRGDTGQFVVSVTDPEGNPLDLSEASWLCQIRSKPDQAVIATLDVALNPGDPDPIHPSSIIVTLGHAQSSLVQATAAWDLQMTLSGSVITLITGNVILSKDISQ